MPSDSRARWRREDWDTLLRQLGTQMERLARSALVQGDPEAERRLRAMLRARDMEALDEAADVLADYLYGKRDAIDAAEARRKGEPPPPPRRPLTGSSRGIGEVRRLAAMGPSGEDFDLQSSDSAPQGLGRRGRLRLQ